MTFTISDLGFTIFYCGGIITDGKVMDEFALHATGEVDSVSRGFGLCLWICVTGATETDSIRF